MNNTLGNKEKDMQSYTVSVSNTYYAESPEDAVRQMVAYLLDNAAEAGYVVMSRNDSVFLDAEEVLSAEQ